MNLLDLIEADGVKLTRHGATFRGRCPFHEGKTETSLLVDADAGKYHCFGCDQHGDAIQWLRERRGLSFGEACKVLGHDQTGHVRHLQNGNRKKQSHRRTHGRKKHEPFLTRRSVAYGRNGTTKQGHGYTTRRAFLTRRLRRRALASIRRIYTSHGEPGALRRHIKRTGQNGGNGYRRGWSFLM